MTDTLPATTLLPNAADLAQQLSNDVMADLADRLLANRVHVAKSRDGVPSGGDAAALSVFRLQLRAHDTCSRPMGAAQLLLRSRRSARRAQSRATRTSSWCPRWRLPRFVATRQSHRIASGLRGASCGVRRILR